MLRRSWLAETQPAAFRYTSRCIHSWQGIIHMKPTYGAAFSAAAGQQQGLAHPAHARTRTPICTQHAQHVPAAAVHITTATVAVLLQHVISQQPAHHLCCCWDAASAGPHMAPTGTRSRQPFACKRQPLTQTRKLTSSKEPIAVPYEPLMMLASTHMVHHQAVAAGAVVYTLGLPFYWTRTAEQPAPCLPPGYSCGFLSASPWLPT